MIENVSYILKILSNLIGDGFLIVGLFFVLTSIMGVIRIKDNLTRLHAGSVSDSFGLPLCYIGIMLKNGFNIISVKFFVVLVLVIIASPVIVHNIARMIYFIRIRNINDV